MEKVYLVIDDSDMVRGVFSTLDRAKEFKHHTQLLYSEEDYCYMTISVFEVH